MTSASACGVGFNYHPECEDAVNGQINTELCAFYTYLSMSFHFERDDVALPGLVKYLKKASEDKMEHAQRLMRFQNDRGGRIALKDIRKPAKDAWGSVLEAMKTALELEKSVKQTLLDLHLLADKHKDSELSDCLENLYLKKQVQRIKEIGDHITNLERVGPGQGEYHFDSETL